MEGNYNPAPYQQYNQPQPTAPPAKKKIELNFIFGIIAVVIFLVHSVFHLILSIKYSTQTDADLYTRYDMKLYHALLIIIFIISVLLCIAAIIFLIIKKSQNPFSVIVPFAVAILSHLLSLLINTIVFHNSFSIALRNILPIIAYLIVGIITAVFFVNKFNSLKTVAIVLNSLLIIGYIVKSIVDINTIVRNDLASTVTWVVLFALSYASVLASIILTKGIKNITPKVASPYGYAPQPQGYVPQQQGYVPQQQEYAPQQQGYVPQPQGYAPQQQGYAPQQQGYAPQQQYNPQQNYSQQYAPQQNNYQPQQPAYNPQPQAPAPEQNPFINNNNPFNS